MHQRYTLIGGGIEFKVWLKHKQNWEYFSAAVLPAPDSMTGVDKVVQVKGSSVRQGPNDPSRTTRVGHSRKVWSAPHFKGTAVPGKTIFLCEPNPLYPETQGEPAYVEKRQVAFAGPLLAVYNYFKTNAKFQMVLVSPSGRSYPIDKPGTAQAAQMTPPSLLISP